MLMVEKISLLTVFDHCPLIPSRPLPGAVFPLGKESGIGRSVAL